MTTATDFDSQAAHNYFSATCFNQAWELLEQRERTPEEDETMIRLSQTSLWHWTQREDCTNRHLSIGYWQLSRIYAVLGQADHARRYGQLCLHYSQGEAPFYQAYAYEALARAELVAGNRAQMAGYLRQARQLLDQIDDLEEKGLIEKDLETMK